MALEARPRPTLTWEDAKSWFREFETAGSRLTSERVAAFFPETFEKRRAFFESPVHTALFREPRTRSAAHDWVVAAFVFLLSCPRNRNELESSRMVAASRVIEGTGESIARKLPPWLTSRVVSIMVDSSCLLGSEYQEENLPWLEFLWRMVYMSSAACRVVLCVLERDLADRYGVTPSMANLAGVGRFLAETTFEWPVTPLHQGVVSLWGVLLESAAQHPELTRRLHVVKLEMGPRIASYSTRACQAKNHWLARTYVAPRLVRGHAKMLCPIHIVACWSLNLMWNARGCVWKSFALLASMEGLLRDPWEERCVQRDEDNFTVLFSQADADMGLVPEVMDLSPFHLNFLWFHSYLYQLATAAAFCSQLRMQPGVTFPEWFRAGFKEGTLPDRLRALILDAITIRARDGDRNHDPMVKEELSALLYQLGEPDVVHLASQEARRFLVERARNLKKMGVAIMSPLVLEDTIQAWVRAAITHNVSLERASQTTHGEPTDDGSLSSPRDGSLRDAEAVSEVLCDFDNVD